MNRDNYATRTVREIGGEVWSELQNSELADKIEWDARNAIVDLVMGVLARHAGKRLENDEDLPVAPLATNVHNEP